MSHTEGRTPIPATVRERLCRFTIEDLRVRSEEASRELYNLGITFLVFSESGSEDRILPFDVVPRLIPSTEWTVLEAGVKQRVAAINCFLKDIYNDQKILKDGVVPADLVLGHKAYRKAMVGLSLPFDTYAHVAGVDIIRDQQGEFRVLEDNARVPSGVSYVVENRQMMQRILPELIDRLPVRPVDSYGLRLRSALSELAPGGVSEPSVVLLSPGSYNSAYFEHVFLAREMGVPLVEGNDLFVENDHVYMRTIEGPARVDAIYRRLDDDFLDPTVFRSDSLLGVPGLVAAYAKGNIAIANAIGTGVADDKAVYAYMPRIIKYFLDEEPIIQNVETNICREKDGLAYTLDNLESLVVKPVGEAGGYGITIGPQATRAQLDACRDSIKANPANYISQPVIGLSVCPTLTPDGMEPRHVDFRPFAVTGRDTWVLPGGLTRVALQKGRLIVNSSQGGGSKDTWVLG
ncbi:circularly permuted type 2 ATP-grasp protein [Fodinicurvata sp. EGI_FJ10296]|uniref:circularly permuted type 2 ATP-grasp protein n=1 Tax=Fodinicurvata sp. EGI_FJ10296 TaxID=3231908 RepID=UPI003451965F